MNKLILKSSFIICLILSCVLEVRASITLNDYDLNEPIGWGTVDGSITGSGDANAVVVTNATDFINALEGTTAKTIYVKGTLEFSGIQTVESAQNKTVYGLPGSALSNPTHTKTVSKTGILMLKKCKNIILRNLTFKSAGAYDIDGNDNLTVQGCTYIWVDHCDFQDGVDGNLDCNNGSNYISVTWCRFHYYIAPWSGGSGGSNDHRYTNLWGGSDSNIDTDGGKLNTTFANCWWDEGCVERMPRIRFGKVHLLNCLYSSSTTNYCVGGGYRSNAYIEGCAFTSTKAQKYPWKKYATESSYTDYNVTITNCSGASNNKERSGSQEYFVPSDYYKYTAYDATLVESVVSSATGAGATLNITEGEGLGLTAINGVEESDNSEITSTEYFTANGMKVSQPQKGLNVIVTKYANGKSKTSKVIVK